jgi:glycosyltransferase involved in cell wall biosynthesis
MPALFLLSSLCIGGSERKTVRIVNALRARGHDIHLAWLNEPETLRREIAPGTPTISLQRRGKFSWHAIRRLAGYVRQNDIRRIICMNQYPLLYAKALRLAMGVAAPACVATTNATEFHSRKEARQMLIYAPLMRHADRIVFGCNFQMELWLRRYRLPRDKCRFIHNGVDSEYFSHAAVGPVRQDQRAAYGFRDEDFIVGTVGAFRPEKQQVDLVDAIAKLRARGVPARALIVGSGVCEAPLRERIATAGLADQIRLPGELRDVRSALAAMDVFVLTSVAETFSNAALEAMSMERTVVLSDVGGAGEMVQPGSNGFLYPAGDVEKLAEILAQLASGRVRLHEMSRLARVAAEQQFSFSRMVDQYAALAEA